MSATQHSVFLSLVYLLLTAIQSSSAGVVRVKHSAHSAGALRDTPSSVNLALGQPTWQSTTYPNGNSFKAVDGNKSPQWAAGSCAHTAAGDLTPWWAVDLGKQTNVYGVNVTTRAEGHGLYMNNFVVGLTSNPPGSMSPRTNGYVECGRWPGVAPDGQTLFVKCAANLPPSRYVVILGQVEYLIFCELEVYETESPTFSSCKTILAADSESPSGIYSIRTSTGRILDKVYCEMGLNGGGYTFLNPADIPALTDAELQAMFTDKLSVLLRVKMANGTQPYGVLKQLTQYRNVEIKLGVNGNTGYASPINVQHIGSTYLYSGFLPIAVARDIGSTQGLQVNDVGISFSNCDGNPNSYIALFPNFRELAPYQVLAAPNQFYDDLISALKSAPSHRTVPDEYFMFMETAWGGCGTYVQTDERQGLHGVLAASIGFR